MTAVATPLATGRWPHVASRSACSFTVRNFGLNKVTGTVPVVEAWVDVDAAGQPRQVRALLDLRGIDTGHRKRDADLQKPHLLGTADHPTLEFTGQVRATGEAWQLSGRLAGRRSCDVTMPVEVVRADGDVAVRARLRVDRRMLGVRAPRLLIGRRLDVTVDAAFTPPS